MELDLRHFKLIVACQQTNMHGGKNRSGPIFEDAPSDMQEAAALAARRHGKVGGGMCHNVDILVSSSARMSLEPTQEEQLHLYRKLPTWAVNRSTFATPRIQAFALGVSCMCR